MDYEHDYYLNSLCLESVWLHNYEIVKSYNHGVIERCSHCKDRKYFSNRVSNRRYMAYHVKQMLQPYMKRFSKEFPNFKRL